MSEQKGSPVTPLGARASPALWQGHAARDRLVWLALLKVPVFWGGLWAKGNTTTTGWV